MSLDQLGYPAFATFPAGPGTVGPTRIVDATARRVRVTLSGTFSVRVQISNAQSTTVPEHLFVPPEASWETVATLSAPDVPLDIQQPVRYVRPVVDSGSVTGGNIDTTGQSDSAAGGAEVTRLSTAVSHTTAASLSATPTSAGAQFYQGYRWVDSATGPANGITVLSAPGGRFWRREFDGPVYLRWANPAPGSNIEPLLTSLLAPGLPIDIVLPAESYTLGYTLAMVVGQTVTGAGMGKTYLNYTGTQQAASTLGPSSVGVTAGGGLRNLTLNNAASGGRTSDRIGMIARRIVLTTVAQGVEFPNFNVGVRMNTGTYVNGSSDQDYFSHLRGNKFAGCYIGIQFLSATNGNRFDSNTYVDCDFAYDFSQSGNVSEHNIFTGENVEGCKNWALWPGVADTYMQTWIMLRMENPTTNNFVCEMVDPGRQLFIGLAIVPDEGSNPLANDPTPANRRGVRLSLAPSAQWSTRIGTRGSSYPYAYGAVIDESLRLPGAWNQPLIFGGIGWAWADVNTGRLFYKAGATKPASNLDGVALDGYDGQVVNDAPSLAAGAKHTFTVPCANAAFGDLALVSPSDNLPDGIELLHPIVSAAGTVKITLRNGSAGAIDLSPLTWRVRVFKARGS